MEEEPMEQMDMDTFIDPEKVPAINNLDGLIKELHNVFANEHVNVEYVNALLSAYKSNPADWKRFAQFDQHRYTRNLVDSGNGKFNLMILCWGEQNGSSIHDHSDSHCFVKMLDGDLMETMYEWPSESEPEAELKKKDENVFHKNEVAYINDSMGLHRMENPSHTNGTVSLHLYSPPFDFCRTFDQNTGHENVVQVTFWSKYGTRTPFTKAGGVGVPRRASSASWNELPAPPPTSFCLGQIAENN